MTRSITLMTLVALMLTSCLKEEAVTSMPRVALESVTVSIPFEQGSPFQQNAKTASCKVFKGDSLHAEGALEITDSSVTGTIEKIPAAEDLIFLVEVLDIEGSCIYKGEAQASVKAGKVTPVTIVLKAVDGSAIINGTIEENTATLLIGSAETVRETFIGGGTDINTTSEYRNENFGAIQWFTVGEHDSQTKARGLVHFASSTLPAEAVSYAALVLTVGSWIDHSHENADPMTVVAHKMLVPWNEGDSVPAAISATDLYMTFRDGLTNSETINGATAREASYGTPWNERMVGLDGVDATVDYSGEDTHAMSEGTEITYEIDITAYVNEWIANPSTNFGLLIKPLVENYNGPEISFPLFYTWEQEESINKGPKLRIEL